MVWIEKYEVWLSKRAEYIHVHYPHAYTCPDAEHDFNDMAMLWLNGGVYGVSAVPAWLPLPSSVAHAADVLHLYFILAAVTAGTSVPAGLVVPMLLIGGSAGRLYGLLVWNFRKPFATNIPTFKQANPYLHGHLIQMDGGDCSIVDPGIYAMLGMAAFMGGSGRITVMLATVMIELTGDTAMINRWAPCIVVRGQQVQPWALSWAYPSVQHPFLE